MNVDSWLKLSLREQAQVAIAVLLDGQEGGVFLENDSKNGALMVKLAEQISAEPPELRIPFLGTMLRNAIANMD